MTTIYDFKATMSNGEVLDFKQFKGKVLLIVNTASKCGFTPQFAGLEELNQKYKDKGLVVIGFPCNQFGHQDPGSDEEIVSFCQINYGVTFQIMKKIDVNGDNAEPIFKYLKEKTKNILGEDIKWNFTKFLISSDGKKIKRYAPTTKPSRMEKDIEEMLMVEAV
ncbi:MAG: glutathione peroxidase [Bacteroidales bacterium]|nr:glutathione peroxidase [Bacteroidales bacterium]